MTHQKIGFWRIAAYGTGDFACNLFYAGLSFFLVFYYTDVLGMPPAQAGLLFMLPLLWDGISDPLMGVIASRTQTRFGKYRPYVLLGGPVLGGSFVLVFAAPLLFPSQVFLASLVANLLFRTAYTVVNVPYSSLTASMTRSGPTRGALAASRMVFATFAGFVSGALTLTFAAALGGDDLKQGFVMVAAIYAGVATVLLALVYASVTETETERAMDASLSKTLAFLRENHAFSVLCTALFFGALATGGTGAAIVFYVKYYVAPSGVGADGAEGPVLMAFLGGMTLSAPIWGALTRRFSKRDLWVTAALGNFVFNVGLFFLAPRDLGILIPAMFVSGVLSCAVYVMQWAMVPDTVEYGEWRSGVRDEAIGFGVVQFVVKAATAVGGFIFMLVLGSLGYQDNIAQNPEVLQGIVAFAFLTPAIGSLASVCVIWFYPVSDTLHHRLVTALAWRNARQGDA